MADRAELIIALSGDKDALRSLQNLERAMNTLRGSKISLQIEKTQIDRDIRSVNGAIRELTMGKNEVNVRVNGIDHIITSVEQAQELLDQLTARKRELSLDTAEFNAGLAAGREALHGFKDDEEAAIAKTQELSDAIYALGTAVQSLGSMSGYLGKFADSIGGAFSDMASFFSGGNVFKQISDTLTEMATKTLVGDFGKITSRYDIMSTFTQYMELAGVASDQAAEALQRVNDSILGLPIGLDESAQRLRRYQMYMNDVNAATNLTIGIQKALYAGGASEQMRTTALYQIDRLLSSGSLNTGRQWMSLINGLGVSIGFLAEELGTDAGTLSASLSDGTISTTEFLEALQRLGEGSSEAAQKLDSALGIYKGTLESWISNIQFAAVRGGETILKALDSMLKTAQGNGIVDYLSKVRDAMNDMYASIGQWITRNPQAFTGIFDSVSRLMLQLEKINVSSIAGGVFENIARGIDMLTQALSRLPNGMLEEFVTFATTLAGPLGAVFKTVSSGLPVLIGVFNRFKDFNFEMLLDKIIRQVEILATVVEKVLNILPDSLMGNLMAFGLVWGRPAAAALTALGAAVRSVAEGIALAGNWTAAGNGLSMIVAFAQAHPAIKAAAAALAALAAAVIAIYNVNKKKEADLRKSLGLDEIDKDLEHAEETLKRVNSIIESINDSLDHSNARVDYVRQLADEILKLNDRLKESPQGDLFSHYETVGVMADKVREFNALLPDAAVSMNVLTGRLNESGEAALRMAANYAKAMETLELEDVAREKLEALKAEDWDIRLDIKLTEDNIERLEKELSDLKDELQPYLVDMGYYEANLDYASKLEGSIRRVNNELSESKEKLDGLLNTQADSEGLQESLQLIIDRAEGMKRILEDGVNVGVGAVFDTSKMVSEIEAAKMSVEELSKAYDELREAAKVSLEKQTEGFGKLEKAAEQGLGKTKENVSSQVEALEQYNDNLGGVLEALAREIPGLTEKQRKALIDAVNDMAQEGLDASGIIAGLNKSIENMDVSSLASFADVYLKKQELLAQGADYTALAQTLSEHTTEAIAALNDDSGIFGDNIEKLLFGEKGVEGLDFDTLEKEFGELVEKSIKPVTESLNGEEGSLSAALKGIGEQVATTTSDTIPTIVKSFGELDEALKSTQKELKETEKELGNTETAMKETEGAAKTLKEQIDRVTEAVQRMAEMMSRKMGDMAAFKGALDLVAESASTAAQMVAALAGAIASLESKEITIGVNYAVHGGGALALPVSTGGFITENGVLYRKDGGSVFKPVGTDTVPAMLTPGEFVVNRNAVKKLGLPFMNALNHIDIGKAFDELIRTAYRPPQFYPVYSTVNNRTDNRSFNYSPNFYGNTAENASRRIASRWARSLVR